MTCTDKFSSDVRWASRCMVAGVSGAIMLAAYLSPETLSGPVRGYSTASLRAVNKEVFDLNNDSVKEHTLIYHHLCHKNTDEPFRYKHTD